MRSSSLLALALAAALAGAASGADKKTGYRIATTYRPVHVPLPDGAGTLALSPGTSAVVSGKRPGPWRVELEHGEAAMTVAKGGKAAGSTLAGGSTAMKVDHGTSVLWRKPGGEGGVLTTGSAAVARATTAPAEPLAPGRAFQTSGRELSFASPPAWMDVLARQSERAEGPGLIKIPITVPPSGPAAAMDPSLTLRPLAMGTAQLSLPASQPLRATEKLSSIRERIMLSVPGQGMAGPALYVDHARSEPGRVHNVVWSGGRGLTRFHLHPEWTVTLAPGTLMEIEGQEQVAAAQAATPRLKLHRGALVCEPARPEVTSPPKTVGLPAFDGLVVSSDTGPLAGSKVVLFAAPTPGTTPEAALAHAAELLRDALGGPGATITLLAQLPAPPRGIGSYVPVQADLPGPEQLLNLSVMGPAPKNREDVKARALEITVREGRTELPVAIVSPAELVLEPGADPQEMQVLMVPRGAETKSHLRDVLDRWGQYFAGRVAESSDKEGQTRTALGVLVIALVALVLARGVYRQLDRLVRRLFGLVRVRCPRCDLILDQIPLAEVGSRDRPEPVFQLLDFDNLTDVNRQQRSRASLLDWIRGRTPPAGPYRYRLRAAWCQRCLQGTFTSEVLKGGEVMDESDLEFSGSDTHALVVALQKPDKQEPAK